MARRVVAFLLVAMVGGCGPVTSSEVVGDSSLRGRETSLGSRMAGPPRLAPRLLLGAAPTASIVPYDRLLDARGEPVDGEAMASLIQRRELLEALYAEADRGDWRAVRVKEAVEGRFAEYGRLSAQEAVKLGCLMAPEFFAGCRPNPVVLEAVKDSPAAARLWAVTFKAYETRLRELAPQQKLTEATLNALMAAAVWTKTMGAVETEGTPRAPPEPPPETTRAGAGAVAAEVRLDLAALAETSGLDRAVLEAKLAEAESSTLGPRLPADVEALEKTLPKVEHPPTGVAGDNPLWHDYVRYVEERLAQMKRARQAAALPKKPVEPPRTWESYKRLRTDWKRGLDYQRARTGRLHEDAKLPPEQRKTLKAFKKPIVQENVGVDAGEGVHYSDVLVVEGEVAPGQPPRVETFSFKSRNFTSMSLQECEAQITRDVRDTKLYYDGTVDIRRPALGLRGQKLPVSKAHLIYDAKFKPEMRFKDLMDFLEKLAKEGVEVRFE